ncbi:MAG: ATP-binding cassette domain-containing protein [Myxococcota bacterium]
MNGVAAPLFELRGAGIEGPGGALLRDLDWIVHDRAVTVLLGPAGIGKSLLLRRLSGDRLPEGWTESGQWLHRGRSVDERLPPQDVAWCPQRVPRRDGKKSAPPGGAHWRSALDGRASTVLLDEPERGATFADREALVGALADRRARGAAVVVTHDLRFAQSIADDVCLIVAGGIAAATDARTFFQQPPNDLARRFLMQGNCWPPGPRPPELPSHFRWIIPGALAGMGRPGLLGDEDADLEAVAAAGVELLVSLTREPVANERLRSFGMQGRHFPIKDMGVPAIGPAARVCAEMTRRIEAGSAVALHCHAGLGRTGTMLATYLVWSGADAEEAIATVRGVSSKYIQTESQVEFIRRFAEET